MRIGIDMSSVSAEKTGIGYYTASLVKALDKVDSENKYFLYLRRECFDEFSGLKKNFIKRKIPGGKRLRLPRVHLYLSFAIARDRLDLFFSPNYLVPVVCPAKSVITIHDMTYTFFSDKHIKKQLLLFNTLLPGSVRKCSRIIADSENTKKDIMKVFKVPEEKIVVIHIAADGRYRPLDNKEMISKVKRKYKISSDYILYVGTIEPRKNIIRLIESFNLLKKNNRINYKLVIAGRKGWKYDEIIKTADRSDFRDEIIFTGYVPEEDMVCLYNGAELMVYPSLYEGFGLPPLEAMACGTPVITSNTSSLPEVVGDAAILIDPNDTRRISEAILKVLENRKLRNELAGKGLKRAGMFSWEKTAGEVRKVFHI